MTEHQVQETKRQFRYGMLTPGTREAAELRGSSGNAEQLLPPDIAQVVVHLGAVDYTDQSGVEEVMADYWAKVDQLVRQGVDRITIRGFPVSANLGRSRVLKLLEETTSKTGLPANTDAEAVVAAFEYLGVRHIAVGSRWHDEMNQAVVKYLGEAGLEVVAITSAGQHVADAHAMSVEMGIRLAIQLGREAMRKAPQAEGLFLAGGAWRSLAAVPVLEEDFGKPVVTNPIATAWTLIHTGIAPPVHGWGRLLASP